MNNQEKEVKKIDDIKICSLCGEASEKLTEVPGQQLCEECFSDNYFTCYACKQFIHRRHLTENGKEYCSDCWHNTFFSCKGCSLVFERDNSYCCDNLYRGCCDNHNESAGKDEVLRDYDKKTRAYLSRTVGSIIKTKRIFSAEIECCYPGISSLERVAENSPGELGIATDGSLSGRGIEFITPKLSGKKGEDFIKDLCKSLNTNDFKVNKTCGLHIHLNGGKKLLRARQIVKGTESPEILKNIFLFFYHFDEVLMSFMPKSRRENRYCYSLKSMYSGNPYIIDWVMKCKTLNYFECLWYKESRKSEIKLKKSRKYDSSRYAGVNFHSLLSNNHIEIRFHSGTTDSTKILNWIELNCNILDRITANKVDMSKVINLNTSISDKTKLFFKLIKPTKELQAFYLQRQNKFLSDREDNE